MRDDLVNAFHTQSRACRELGSPFMARLMQLLPGLVPPGSALAERLDSTPGDPGPSGASLPLRLAGGLHHLVLTRADPGLISAWPPAQTADLAETVASALCRHEQMLTDWIRHAPQTNEVGRSAVILPAAAEAAARFGLPLRLSELGASAGLNLNFHRYALDAVGVSCGAPDPVLRLAPAWTGAPPRPGAVAVAEARGVDLNPLSPLTDGLRLLSYIWPDQLDRLSRMRAALAAAEAHPPAVDQGEAADWLEARLADPCEGQCHFVFHTIALQYFPAASQQRIRRAMVQAAARATTRAPLAWLSMEADGRPDGAAVTLRMWPGDTTSTARAGFHGQWVRTTEETKAPA